MLAYIALLQKYLLDESVGFPHSIYQEPAKIILLAYNNRLIELLWDLLALVPIMLGFVNSSQHDGNSCQ